MIELSSSQKCSDVHNKVHDYANSRCRNVPFLAFLSLCVFMGVQIHFMCILCAQVCLMCAWIVLVVITQTSLDFILTQGLSVAWK